MSRRDVLTRSKKKRAEKLLRSGQLREARELYVKICQQDPADYESWVNAAALSGQLGAYGDAEFAYRQAAALRPNEVQIQLNLARLAELRGDMAATEAAYLDYLRIAPKGIDGLRNLALLYLNLHRFDEARDLCQRAVEAGVADAGLYNCFANVLQEQGHFDEALAHYHTAQRLGFPEAAIQGNLGNLYYAWGRFDQSREHYLKSLALAPDNAATLGSLAFLYTRLCQFEEALGCFDKALAIEPDNHGIRWNRALLLLLLGRFKEGWRDYESRFGALEAVRQFGTRRFSQPRWDGRPAPGKTVLVYSDQGLGDALHFCRYLPMVKARVGRVIFECPASLHPLMESLDADIRCVAPDDEAALAGVDLQIPLMSLPGLFETDLEHMPTQVPYLSVAPERVQAMAAKAECDGFKVGLVWAGNPNNLNDRRRSIPLSMLAPLAAVPGACFYSLQKGPAVAQLQALPGGMTVIDLEEELGDFSRTAALIMNLDLVITVDTAVAHLAGALGRPVWTLIYTPPDWRWLLDRDDSPWYPSMRLFRQTSPDDWSPVVDGLAAALMEQVS